MKRLTGAAALAAVMALAAGGAANGQLGGSPAGKVTAPGAGAVPKPVTLNDPVRLRVIVPSGGNHKYYVSLSGSGNIPCVVASSNSSHCDRMVQRHSIVRLSGTHLYNGDSAGGQPYSGPVSNDQWDGACAGTRGTTCELRMPMNREVRIKGKIPGN